jgi:hypothetical protein
MDSGGVRSVEKLRESKWRKTMIREYLKISKTKKMIVGDQIKTVINNKKVGVMVAFVPTESNQIVIGWSRCHSKLDKFDRSLGTQISEARALKYIYNGKMPKPPHSIKNELKRFALRAAKYYKDKELPEWLNYL